MGVGDSAYYETYKHLNAKIIKPAVAEVNKTSNIIVTPEIRKRGRAVSDIRFKIEENPQLAILDLDDGTGLRNAPVYGRLRELGVSDRLARQWLAEHGEPYVSAKLEYVAGQGNVRNPVGYLTAAMKSDYAVEVPVPTSGRAAQLKVVQALVAARTPTQRDADKRLFLSGMDDGAARQDFERHGWMSALNASAIRAFWEELVSGAFDGVDGEGGV